MQSILYENIGTLNLSYFEFVNVTLMLQCKLTKSDESTFFVLNVDWVFVRNWVLPYINENAKRSAASILMLYIFTFLCLSLLHLVQVKQIVKVK